MRAVSGGSELTTMPEGMPGGQGDAAPGHDGFKRGGHEEGKMEHEKHGGKSDHDADDMKRGGHARGGKSESDGEPEKEGKVQEYNAQGSNEMKEAKDETPEFRKGGRPKRKSGGHAEGKMEERRMDRRPRRAAGGHTPYSSASAFREPESGSAGRGYEGTERKT
jgi:hypothetical protein